VGCHSRKSGNPWGPRLRGGDVHANYFAAPSVPDGAEVAPGVLSLLEESDGVADDPLLADPLLESLDDGALDDPLLEESLLEEGALEEPVLEEDESAGLFSVFAFSSRRHCVRSSPVIESQRGDWPAPMASPGFCVELCAKDTADAVRNASATAAESADFM
jgi:hypothetical protein